MKATPITLITEVADLNKAIDNWASKGKKWAAEGHQLAMSALTLMSKHDDIGPMNRLLLSMPKGTKVKSMKEWMLAFAKVKQNDGQDAATKPLVFNKEGEYDIENASKNPWFNFSPETAADPVFDVRKALEAIVKRAEGKELVHGDLLTKVQELVVADVEAAGDEPQA